MSSSSMRRPLNWLAFAAFAAAFWITLRVVAAAPPPAVMEPVRADDFAAGYELRDPALERLIAGLAPLSRAASRR